jgi:hypothetical protein
MHLQQAYAHLLVWREEAPKHSDEEVFDFFNYCLTHLGLPRSQLFQDLFVLYQLEEKKKGYFVEFGASEDSKYSNTAALEQEFKWNGLVAQGHHSWTEAALQDRKCKADKRRVAATTGADTVSLNDLLKQNDAPKDIDYISIDVGGAEYDVLSAFDFDAHDVKIFSIDHRHRPTRAPIHALLTSKGYTRKLDMFSGSGDWYVKEG